MCRTINTAVSCSLLRRCTKNYYVRSLTLCLLMIILLIVEQEGADAFFVTPSSSLSSLLSCSSQRRHNQYQHQHRHRHRLFVHPSNNNKGSPSFGRLESSYRRVKVDPPKDLKVMTPDEVAESLETILKEQRNDACEQAYIGSLDAWMVASNKAKIKKGEDNKAGKNDSRIVEYGKRMEDVLTLMETNCVSGTTIDAYATVIHLYVCGKESYAALRVLRRMENQLLIQQEQQQAASSSTITGSGDSSECQNNNFKLRRIQYNRVLQGLVSTSETNPLHLKTAIQLLMSMSLQEEFLCPPDAGFIMEPSFSPTNITPDAKSFAIVLVAMIMTQEEGDDVNDNDELVVTLIDQAKKLDQLNDFLLKKIDRAMVSSSGNNNKERFDIIKQRISLPN